LSGRFPLYTDADIRGPLIKQLKRAGWDVVRAVDEYPERTKDPIHFQRAVELGRVLITSDENRRRSQSSGTVRGAPSRVSSSGVRSSTNRWATAHF
jgi:hypothetical protein